MTETFAPYFSPEGYRDILRHADALGYSVVPFRRFNPPSQKPVLLLRHDLDHSIRSAVEIAENEAIFGLSATYFVQTTCAFYNLLSPESRRLLVHIEELGHEIGLHYDATRYQGEMGRRHLECDLALLEDIVGTKIVSASQHLPSSSGPVDLAGCIENEAYEPRFTQEPMTYISDSLMAWRQAEPHEMLVDRRSFQLLTHPMKWWRSFASLNDALTCACESECEALEASYHAVRVQYNEILRDRPLLDAAFKQRTRGL